MWLPVRPFLDGLRKKATEEDRRRINKEKNNGERAMVTTDVDASGHTRVKPASHLSGWDLV